jgi:hypothetical protein
LIKGGWGSIEKLSRAKPDDLTVLRGVGEKTAAKIIEAAKAVLANAMKEKPANETPVAEEALASPTGDSPPSGAEETAPAAEDASAPETPAASTEPHDSKEKG